MRRVCIPLVALMLAAAAPALAQTQAEMNQEACARADAADAELNVAYQSAMARWADVPLRTRSLRTAQRAWLVFRDAHLDALFPFESGDENPRVRYGSIYPMLRCAFLESLTEDRTDQLRDWVECEGGPSCIAGRD